MRTSSRPVVPAPTRQQLAACLTLVWTLSLGAAGTAAAAPLAVLPVDGADLSAAERAAIDAAVRQELSALDLELVPAREVSDQVASAAELGLRCAGDDMPCVMKIGTIAGFQRVLAPQATRTDAGVILTLGLATIQPPKTDAVAEQTITLNEGGADVRGPIVAIFTPEQYVGSVLITGVPAGARIFIDGKERGTAPLTTPLEGIRAGVAHDVRVEAAGLEPITTQVLVAFDQVAEVELAMANTTSGTVGEVTGGGVVLSEAEPSPLLSLPFHALLWSGLAMSVVGAAAAVGGGYYLVTTDGYLASGADGYNDRLSAQNLGRVSAGVLTLGVIAIIAGVATSGSSALLFF